MKQKFANCVFPFNLMTSANSEVNHEEGVEINTTAEVI